MTAPTFRRNAGRRRFEAELDGAVAAFLNYRESGDRLELVHTEVAPEHRGRGVGEQLVAFALGEAERGGAKVVPSCGYVAAYIRRHPQHQALVAT